MHNNKTRKLRKNVLRGWKKERPGVHDRTIMLRKCGRKCFLGPHKSFPICKRRTCKISRRGLHAAYTRARQYKHQKIARSARRLLSSSSLSLF